jgi:CheY-like chemotaxis protein
VPTAEPNPEPGTFASQRVLKAEHDPYRAVFDLCPTPMMLCEVGTLRVIAANVAASKLHGTCPELLQGRTLFELRRVSDLTSIMLKRAVGHEIALGFGYHVRQDGATFPVQLTVHPSEVGGKPLWLCVLKSLEELLAPREGEPKRRLLEAVGRLAGVVAHDINNLLSVILSFGSLATAHLASDSPALRDLTEIRGATERATLLTKQLLSLSRKGPSCPKSLRLNEVVIRLEKLLGRMLDDGTELVLDLAPDVDPVMADPAQIERLLVQLVAETHGGGHPGTLRIETRNVELETERGRERHVLLRVTDSHGSLTPDVGALSAFVDSGNAWLEAEAGVGTQFVACFPSARGESGVAAARGKVRRETVLVVQDNPHLRKTLRNYFVREGFRVLDAESGLDAMRQLEPCASVDLLLTDFVLTDGSGSELCRALRDRLPSLRVLVSIGDAEQRDALRLDERTESITKPFDLRELDALVQRLLDQPDVT